MEKIFIGNFDQGLTTNRLPFFIDNNAFPTMYNFYSWRGRAKRKRGTIPVGRLSVQFSIPSGTDLSSGAINLITAFSLPSSASIVPGSISFTVGANTYTEPMVTTGVLTGSPSGTGTVNYATGAVTITGGGSTAITGTFSYYPGFPVMGLEDFLPPKNPTGLTTAETYPLLLAFDTDYSYQNFTSSSLASTTFFNTTYFKNPTVTYTDGTTPYVAKTTQTPFVWTGKDYQQFWTTNFEQALWATNGNPGMQIQAITTITRSSATKMVFSVASSPAKKGDFVFVNEIVNSSDTPPSTTYASTINGQTGYVSVDPSGGTVTVVFPYADISATGTYSGGIMQYLTNVVPTGSSTSMGDGIKWYDGDPTASTGLPSSSSAGWVNFNPPLSAGSQIINNYTSSSANSTNTPFYLVGCKAILAYKDRILFFGCYIQTSASAIAGSNPIYLQDTVIWSWNGSPYYTCSFTTPITSLTNFVSILTPGTGLTNIPAEGAAVNSFYVDQTGFGGYLSAGIQQPIVTVGLNEDVLLVSFTGRQTRFVYSGNDIDPFRFFGINSELGTSATFSAITLDRGVLSFGVYGFAMTTQNSAQRIDLVIPDAAFQINSLNYGVNRINSARDYYKEWVYFSYPPEGQPTTSLFPTQTFFFNYRDNTWAIFYENFTCHGSFWRTASVTWATLPYTNWDEWTDPWDSPDTGALFPQVIAGNPQGFVVIKGQSTGEAPTGNIADAVAYSETASTLTQITSTNHCVSVGDYLYITGCLGTVNLNTQIGQVTLIIDTDNFVLDIVFTDTNPYIGLGVYTRLSQPNLLSKQFPSYWQNGRQTRIGAQQYLLDNSGNPDGQITLNMYLSMDPNTVWNQGPIVPDDSSTNNSLIYSQLVYTCPESTNLGLTPANTNLQMPTATTQKQIWHRMNTSMIGDTVQFGITLNDSQMRDLATATSEITLHAAVIDTYPGPMLS